MKGFIKCLKKYQDVVMLVTDESVEQTKRNIKNVSNFKFVKTLEEFEKNISPNSYLAFSISITEFAPVAELIKRYPKCFFHKVLEPPWGLWSITNIFEINKEKNIDKWTYLMFDLINHIKKEVRLLKCTHSQRNHKQDNKIEGGASNGRGYIDEYKPG